MEADDLTPPEGTPVVPLPARPRRRWAWWLLLAAVLLAATAIEWPLRVTEPAELRATTRVELRTPIAGLVARVHVREGDRVRAGDVIAELDLRALAAEAEVLRAQWRMRTAELARLHHGARPEELRRAEQLVAQRSAAARFGRDHARRLGALHRSGHASTEEHEQAQLDADVAARELAAARAELALVQAGPRDEDIAAKQAEVDGVAAELAFVTLELGRGVLRSPSDGVVVTPRIEESIGRALEPGALVAEIVGDATMRVEVLVPERELDAVAPGQAVALRVRSLPGREYVGVVEAIGAAVETVGEHEELRAVRVTATVDNDDGLLKQGMGGWAEIDAGPRSLAALGLRRIVRFVRVRWLI
ncbi:MAG: HlyD family efflux transporter periplasmic adaptor subunit [Nannocystaceae bacterium]|nr:HlyD family efflux transporter periplasmic adaptor subunit [Nannocystaceae bacterium]